MDEKAEIRRPKRVASRFFNAFMILIYFLLFLLALISMSAFANLQFSITNSEVYGRNDSASGRCILNAHYDEMSSPPIRLSNNTNACNFAIVGEALIAFYALVAIVVLVIKIVAGVQLISCFLVVEVIVNTVVLLGSFSVALVISIGLSLTCNNLSDDSSFAEMPCSEYTIPSSMDGSDNIQFYKRLDISQVTAWLAFITMIGIIVFYFICICLYAYGRRKEKHARNQLLTEQLEKSGEDHVDPNEEDKTHYPNE